MIEPYSSTMNAIVTAMAQITNPNGYDLVATFEEAPTTLEAVVAYHKEHGKLCIAAEDSDGTIYADASVNHDLRAWHDSVHVKHGFEFNAAGEAAAVYVQIAQVVYCDLYGERAHKEAARLLLADILGLVHYHLRTGKWPRNKAKSTVAEAIKWKDEADRIVVALYSLPTRSLYNYEQEAIRLAAKWGNPYATA